GPALRAEALLWRRGHRERRHAERLPLAGLRHRLRRHDDRRAPRRPARARGRRARPGAEGRPRAARAGDRPGAGLRRGDRRTRLSRSHRARRNTSPPRDVRGPDRPRHPHLPPTRPMAISSLWSGLRKPAVVLVVLAAMVLRVMGTSGMFAEKLPETTAPQDLRRPLPAGVATQRVSAR